MDNHINVINYDGFHFKEKLKRKDDNTDEKIRELNLLLRCRNREIEMMQNEIRKLQGFELIPEIHETNENSGGTILIDVGEREQQEQSEVGHE